MRKTISIIIALVVVFGSFYVLNGYIYKEKQNNSEPTLNYMDAVYVIDGNVIKLKDGVSEVVDSLNPSVKIVTRYFGNEVKTDLDLDGREDVAFLLTQTKGGDEIFYYFVGALNTENGYVGTQAVFLGDRIAPQTTGKGEGKIVVVNYVIRNAGEGFEVRPSMGKSLWLLLDPNTMQWGEVAQNFEGEVDPKRMSLFMKTWSWISAEFDDAIAAPKSPNKFSVTFNKDGTFSATTDCNGIGGSYEAKDGKIKFGQMMSTLMFCEDSQEDIFKKILGDAEGYTFTSKGELVLGLKWNGTAVFK